MSELIFEVIQEARLREHLTSRFQTDHRHSGVADPGYNDNRCVSRYF